MEFKFRCENYYFCQFSYAVYHWYSEVDEIDIMYDFFLFHYVCQCFLRAEEVEMFHVTKSYYGSKSLK